MLYSEERKCQSHENTIIFVSIAKAIQSIVDEPILYPPLCVCAFVFACARTHAHVPRDVMEDARDHVGCLFLGASCGNLKKYLFKNFIIL